jgi:hypothetical protein
MSYEIALNDAVAQELRLRPTSVQRVILASLQRLAANPSQFTHGSPPSHHGQAASIKYEQPGIPLGDSKLSVWAG